MAADITQLAKDYRLRARLAYRDDLRLQRTWLEDQFKLEFDSGSGEVINIASGEGGSSGYAYRGSTAEERLAALRLALDQIGEEITSADAGLASAPSSGFMLIPRVVSAPH